MILVLDGNPEDRQLIVNAIQGETDRGVVECSSIDEAIETLYDRPEISIVITDLHFTGSESPPELVRRIASAVPSLPLIVVSEATNLEEALTWGATEVVPKGKLDELGKSVRRSRLRKKADIEIRYRLSHDGLTGLANRVAIRDEIDRRIHQYKRHHHLFSLLYLDLDKFKPINDTYGHAAGDLALREIAKRIKGCLRDNDMAGRVGGDEFAIVASGSFMDPLCQRVLDAIKQPMQIGNVSHELGCSIGFCTVAPGDTVQDLIRTADEAMLRIKREGGPVKFKKASEETALSWGGEFADEVDHALVRDELHLVYQPILTADTREVVEVEALLRWNRPGGTKVSPTVFVPALESSGGIIPVGKWVLETALKRLPEIQRKYPHARVGVNVSGVQIEHGVSHTIASALQEIGVQPDQLTIEITETALVTPTEVMQRELHILRHMGIRIALDDFGAGATSLATLVAFKVDVVKLDRIFTVSLPNPRTEALIRAIVGCVRDLGGDVVAEGVETQQQLNILTALGVTLVQGFMFSGPVVI